MSLDQSRSVMKNFADWMPGGDTRTSTFFHPFPIVLERGAGYTVWDIDDNQYVDLLNNFTSLVHGHAHPEIAATMAKQARLGASFSAPHRSQGELASRITERIPSAERVRFTNSGTEAVMQAVRAARVVTGRDLIVKAHGGYHGSWDQVPMTVEDLLGTPQAVADLIRWVDYNDSASLETVMQQSGGAVAAIIVEPVLGGGGVIEATPQFLETARRLATANGVILIFDEVITARLSYGGQQEKTGVIPDLTTLGKVIGGGLPVGAVAGSAAAMEIFDPRRDGFLYHGGTFNGNPMTMTAGSASLDLLDRRAIEHINALGAKLALGIAAALTEAGIAGTVTSAGSLVQMHLGSADPVERFNQVDLSHPLLTSVHRACLDQGLYYARRGLFNISTVMTDRLLDEVVERFFRAVWSVAGRGHKNGGV